MLPPCFIHTGMPPFSAALLVAFKLLRVTAVKLILGTSIAIQIPILNVIGRMLMKRNTIDDPLEN